MLGIRLAGLLLRQRQWQALQIALFAACFILAGTALASWWIERAQRIEEDKSALTVALVLSPEVSTSQAQLLANDLLSLLPPNMAQVDLLSDSTIATQLHGRYGIPLDVFDRDSLLPRVLRFTFRPSELTSEKFYAFVEQCIRLDESVTVSYPTTHAADVFKREHEHQWMGGILVAVWMFLTIAMHSLHFRTALPLSGKEIHTLRLLGMTNMHLRTTRSLFALYTLIIGMFVGLTLVGGINYIRGVIDTATVWYVATVSACCVVCIGFLQALVILPSR